MRSALQIICCALTLFPMYAIGGTDYTGLWKTDCSFNFGLQIKPVENQLYSISFCGPGGCSRPGVWTPNSTIEGDPKFKVVSSKELGVRRKDIANYFMFKKCNDDPSWIIEPLIPKEESEPQLDCSIPSDVKNEGVMIAWITDVRVTTQFSPTEEPQTTKVEPFRPIALLNGSSLTKISHASIHKGQQFWRALSPSSKPVTLRSANSFLDHMNEDHCVYYGSVSDSKLHLWTLLSSEPLPGVFRKPNANDRAEFYRLNKTCVQQGDYPEGKQPPCVRPKLLAVSDINKNGKPEYWATEPYMWDTGITVWENDGKLVPLLEVCVGCSD